MSGTGIARAAAGIVAVLLLATIGYAAFLGYFGGPLFELVEAGTVPAGAERGTAMVFFSGDMGLNTGMGRRIVTRMAADGVPVIGVNSLTGFARGGDAGRATMLVREAVARAAALPGTRRVLLVGQSFGANVILAGAPALPPALRARVPLIELIVPADAMLSRATPGGVLDTHTDGEALPFARQLSGIPVLCIHGDTEEDSLCPIWHQANVRDVALPGDHYLRHDDALVAAVLRRMLRATIG